LEWRRAPNKSRGLFGLDGIRRRKRRRSKSSNGNG